MEKFLSLFTKLGINEKTARIYLDLLEHGTSAIIDISRRTGLHRVEIYRGIPVLEEEKLITTITRGKRTFYRPLSPDRIEELIRDFEKRNAPLLDELQKSYKKLGKNLSVSYEE